MKKIKNKKLNILLFIPSYPAQFGYLHEYLNKHGIANSYYLAQENNNRDSSISPSMLEYSPDKTPNTSEYFLSANIEKMSKHSSGILERVEELIFTHNIDIIVAHGTIGSPHFLFRNIDIPIVSYIEFPSFRAHKWDPLYPPTKQQFIRDNNFEMVSFYEVLKSDRTIVPSNYVKQMFPEVLQEKIDVKMEGFDEDRLDIIGESFLEKKENITYIGFVARGISSAKGFEQFIKIAKNVLKKRKDVCFVVVGDKDGPSYGYEKAFAKNGNFRDFVLQKYDISKESFEEYFIFYDKLEYEHFSTLIYDIDFFLYPLQFGSATWGLFEILLRGKSVIASNSCFIPEVIEDRENGLLVDYHDLFKWKEKIDFLIDFPNERLKLEKKSLKLREAYSMKKIANEYMEIFESLLEKKKKKNSILLLVSQATFDNHHKVFTDRHEGFNKIIHAAIESNIEVLVTTPESIIDTSENVFIENALVVRKDRVLKIKKKFVPQEPLFISEYQIVREEGFEYINNKEKKIQNIQKRHWLNTKKEKKYGISFDKLFIANCFANNKKIMDKHIPYTTFGNKDYIIEEVSNYLHRYKENNIIIKPHNDGCSRGIFIVNTENKNTVLEKFRQEKHELFVAQEYIVSKKYKKKVAVMRVMVQLYSLENLKFEISKTSGFTACSSLNFDKKDIENLNKSLTKRIIPHNKYFKESTIEIDSLWGNIQILVQNSLFSIQKQCIKEGLDIKNFSTLLGYDILLGEDEIPYLLEINHPHTLDVFDHVEHSCEMNSEFKDLYINFFKNMRGS